MLSTRRRPYSRGLLRDYTASDFAKVRLKLYLAVSEDGGGEERESCDPLHGQHQEAVEGERLAHLHTPGYSGHDSLGVLAKYVTQFAVRNINTSYLMVCMSSYIM